MKTFLALGAAALGLALLPAFRLPTENNPEVGSVPPEIDAEGWFNHLGAAPTLASLKGQTVLIEFWATWCGPCVAAWPHLQELHEEYADKGLVILGLSAEEPGVVSDFVDQKGITARVAYGSKTGGKYGVEGIPHTFVVGPDGKLAWHGHPSGLSKGILEKALKGAKARPGGALAIEPRTEAAGRLASVAQAMEQGKLAKALDAARAIAADTTSSEADKSGAQALEGEILAHANLLTSQGERYVENLDVLHAFEVFGLIAQEYGAQELGTQAKARIEGIRKDPVLAKELAAAEAYQKLRSSVARLSTSKQRDKYRDFAEEYKGTKAGERASLVASSS
jgi:thiol-disulfide isomerase/thioredoxin